MMGISTASKPAPLQVRSPIENTLPNSWACILFVGEILEPLALLDLDIVLHSGSAFFADNKQALIQQVSTLCGLEIDLVTAAAAPLIQSVFSTTYVLLATHEEWHKQATASTGIDTLSMNLLNLDPGTASSFTLPSQVDMRTQELLRNIMQLNDNGQLAVGTLSRACLTSMVNVITEAVNAPLDSFEAATSSRTETCLPPALGLPSFRMLTQYYDGDKHSAVSLSVGLMDNCCDYVLASLLAVAKAWGLTVAEFRRRFGHLRLSIDVKTVHGTQTQDAYRLPSYLRLPCIPSCLRLKIIVAEGFLTSLIVGNIPARQLRASFHYAHKINDAGFDIPAIEIKKHFEEGRYLLTRSAPQPVVTELKNVRFKLDDITGTPVATLIDQYWRDAINRSHAQLKILNDRHQTQVKINKLMHEQQQQEEEEHSSEKTMNEEFQALRAE